jgi:hypothetical protein
MAMTQVVRVRMTVQKQPGRTVGHNHLVALIPVISMLALFSRRLTRLHPSFIASVIANLTSGGGAVGGDSKPVPPNGA